MESKLTLGAETFVRAVSDFIFVENTPAKSDVIFIPGASHPEHALRAAELYRQGMAPYVLPAGRFSVKLGHFKGVPEAFRADYPDDYETEWAYLRTVLLKAGVPDEAILREDCSTYTWENAQFSRKVCDAMGLEVRQAILCCRAFHARRAMMYYHAAFPEARILVCPVGVPGESRDDWFTNEKGRRRVMGEVNRLGSQVNEVFEMMLADKRQN
ncbi:MAG: YdcF family protein [Clostridiales bacterium]|nr:YdcF family protein [Clostridiales bacterium]